jgi:alpha-ketoglutarate-dependent 2,4-dichlorophenoxyacetate dioxygenase
MTIQIAPLSPIGAEILGLDLGDDLSVEVFEALRQTILEHGMVLLRDQSLSDEAQLALGRRFGPLEDLARSPDGDVENMIVISNVDADGRVLADAHDDMRSIAINEQWHTDSSFREIPASYSIFKAVVVPPEGGATCFASLQAGWEALDRQTQRDLEGRRAVHDYREAFRRTGSKAAYEGMGAQLVCAQPLVRRHPETGKRGLYVSGHAVRVEGMEMSEGRALIEKLLASCTEEGRVYRHQWQPADVMIWDNRSMLHHAEGFDERYPRVMHHVRVAGTEAVVS